MLILKTLILEYLDLLLGNNHEIMKNTGAVTEYWLRKQACLHVNDLNRIKRMIFSVQSMLRCYKQDSKAAL
jgi:hypothetical protein